MGPPEKSAAKLPRRFWLWPIRPTPRMAETLDRLAGAARPFTTSWKWPVSALAIGVLPLMAGYLLGLSFHHFVAALLLVPLLAACAREDRQGAFLGIVLVAGASHAVLAIWLAARDPAGASVIFPESGAYWQRTEHWVLTGENPEYAPGYWVPVHVAHLGGLLATGYTTFGLVPLHNGFVQLDVMNFYVGRLVAVSDNPVTAIAAGWHPWSFLRVVGYSLLLYEVTSYSLERFTGRTLSTRRRRLTRWAVGLAFCVADGVVKYLAADSVRQILYDNLSP